ncbi:hypothetical protein P171DRAFT_448951 [Karstenula rhodostoma CBS 690.94]|uniref:Ribonuclease H1 N-terminal domain-containing protein n=1 Tax=Karstenula rhodostoma CBS 690.94 TaxID=1392251 RepID=A0A9P4U6L2_9PLEO|nr:hypothetical protein P171DRAFT_448951 [Karstenula rhodostoma CBS 690.94]
MVANRGNRLSKLEQLEENRERLEAKVRAQQTALSDVVKQISTLQQVAEAPNPDPNPPSVLDCIDRNAAMPYTPVRTYRGEISRGRSRSHSPRRDDQTHVRERTLSPRTVEHYIAARDSSSYQSASLRAVEQHLAESSGSASTKPIRTMQMKASKKKNVLKFYGVFRGHKPGVYHSMDEVNLQTEGYRIPCFRGFSTYQDASDYVAGTLKVYSGKFYAVHTGPKPGLFLSWEDVVETNVSRGPCCYKRFDEREEAEAFVVFGPPRQDTTKSRHKPVAAAPFMPRVAAPPTAPTVTFPKSDARSAAIMAFMNAFPTAETPEQIAAKENMMAVFSPTLVPDPPAPTAPDSDPIDPSVDIQALIDEVNCMLPFRYMKRSNQAQIVQKKANTGKRPENEGASSSAKWPARIENTVELPRTEKVLDRSKPVSNNKGRDELDTHAD